MFQNLSSFLPWIIVAVLAATIMGSAYYFYNSTQKDIARLNTINAQLQAANQQLTTVNQQNIKTITELKNSYAQIEQNYSQVQTDFQNIKNQNRILQDSIINSSIGDITPSNVGAEEALINTQMTNMGRCLEIVTGSPLTAREKNAKNAQEFNAQCPWLFSSPAKP